MTREEIAKSLKPIEWDIWENEQCRFANLNDVYEAIITNRKDGGFFLKINKPGEMDAFICRSFHTIEEAKEMAREIQINNMCSFFELEKP